MYCDNFTNESNAYLRTENEFMSTTVDERFFLSTIMLTYVHMYCTYMTDHKSILCWKWKSIFYFVIVFFSFRGYFSDGIGIYKYPRTIQKAIYFIDTAYRQDKSRLNYNDFLLYTKTLYDFIFVLISSRLINSIPKENGTHNLSLVRLIFMLNEVGR